MKEIRLSMGMPVSIEIIGDDACEGIEAVFSYLTSVDERFSPYRPDSEVALLNTGRIREQEVSADFTEVLMLAERTKLETGGYFDIRRPDGLIDPSGIVKGWAIGKAATLLVDLGFENFCIDVGGDIAVSGVNADGAPWSAGVRNPFNRDEIVKVLYPGTAGIATSGSSARGDHIYNPHNPSDALHEAVQITVIGPTITDADRYATAAFAMGKEGIDFIESLQGFEGYSIDAEGIATMTSGLESLTTV